MRLSHLIAAALALTTGSAIAQPTIVSDITPQFISSGANGQRTALAAFVEISGLTPDAEYFAINQIIANSNSDTPTTNGAGNVIFAQPSGTFEFTTGPGFGPTAAKLIFTASSTGTYSGMFINIPTGNARFSAGRTDLQIRIRLNDGNGGTVATDFPTVGSQISFLAYGAATDQGTGIWEGANSDLTPGNFIFLYDNEAGTGRPIAGTVIENTATAQTQTPTFVTNILGQNGAWGTIIPNALPNGVRRIEERDRVTGAIVGFRTSADGNWDTTAGTVDTRNPSGGLTAIVMSGATTTPAPSSVSEWMLLAD